LRREAKQTIQEMGLVKTESAWFIPERRLLDYLLVFIVGKSRVTLGTLEAIFKNVLS